MGRARGTSTSFVTSSTSAVSAGTGAAPARGAVVGIGTASLLLTGLDRAILGRLAVRRPTA
ncbi:MAG: hypothetical protein B7X40_09455 [Cellulomonas sp. 14-74-6]|nr:MAG: hypothetical protein B7X40_09455 [Cellulomonas sp. 14-74-6]